MDFSTHEYVTLKVYMTGHRQALNEAKVLERLDFAKSSHAGAVLVRRMREAFEIPGEVGPHTCLVHNPLSITLSDIRAMAGGQIPESLLKPMVYGLLLALNFLHSEADVVHTGIYKSTRHVEL